MKVIKASVDLTAWRLPISCKTCSSDLELEAKDISYEYQTKGDCYHATCCLCKNYIYISESKLPKIVEVDITSHRRISNYSSDW